MRPEDHEPSPWEAEKVLSKMKREDLALEKWARGDYGTGPVIIHVGPPESRCERFWGWLKRRVGR